MRIKYSQTDLDEDNLKYSEYLKKLEEECKLGLRPSCPICSHYMYFQTKDGNQCDHCGIFEKNNDDKNNK